MDARRPLGEAPMSPSAFDDFLNRLHDAAGVTSQNDLAEKLGLSRSAVTQARKKGAVPESWLLRLFRKYGLNPDWLEKGKGEAFLAPGPKKGGACFQVPKVAARLSAGGGSFETDQRQVSGCVFDTAWLKSKGSPSKMVLMDIFGNSMTPELKDGDTVLVDQGQKEVLAGAIYAVGVEDTILVKRLEKRPNQLVLMSDNKEYAPICLTSADQDSFRVIGRVVWCCREYK